MVETSPAASQIVRFGVYEIDLRAGELRKSGVKVKLPEQPFQILALLLEHPGEVVTREEIQQKLWPDGTFVDFEHSLNAAVKRLREALGDSADTPRYIETLPRRGYRFIYPVDQSFRIKRIRVATFALAVLVVVLAAFLTVHLIQKSRAPRGIGPGGRPAIAVMYFDYAGGPEETRWFSYGVPDMLRTGLAQTPGLDVVSSQRLHEIGGGKLDTLGKEEVLTVARRAGAGAVVVGSIFQSGAEVRIDVEVDDVASGRILFAYSVRGEDVFSLVDELTAQTRRSLYLAAAPATRPVAEVSTHSLEAYRLYTEGMQAYYNLRNADARDLFEKAVEIDPSFAMAYFRLANIARGMGDRGRTDQYRQKVLSHLDRLPEREKLFVQAVEARREEKNPQKAIQLLEQLIERYPDAQDGYSVLAWTYRDYLNQPEKALEILARGVKALPDSGRLHNDYGLELLLAGRYAEALPELETYVRLNPDEPNPLDSLASAYLVTGQPEKALENFARALELDPSFTLSAIGRAWAFAMLGRYPEALTEMDRAEEGFTARNVRLWELHFVRAFLLSRIGRYREAEQEIQRGRRVAENLKNEQLQHAFTALSVTLALERGNYGNVAAAGGKLEKAVSASHDAEFRNGATVFTHFLVGAAAARSGNLSAARARLQALKKIYDPENAGHKRRYHRLAGEVALAAGELPLKTPFLTGDPFGVVFGNNSPFRDWRARIQKAKGDLPGAIATYRKLLTPDMADKWVAVYEPRYVLARARLLGQTGNKDAARKEYERFLELWKNADPGLPELKQARAEYAKLQQAAAGAPSK